ncbi:hypothetical protein cand_028340 [Cryptosporidium andersoni]|uniref:Uncharacterized protein n=1 Tax=Cryptosporidium andersoni TaxID=117008 RepID=A0A1J4MUD9_9CRYT|nr:hypothetical protein cand_028340 [Cryptosporidium andersoni]
MSLESPYSVNLSDIIQYDNNYGDKLTRLLSYNASGPPMLSVKGVLNLGGFPSDFNNKVRNLTLGKETGVNNTDKITALDEVNISVNSPDKLHVENCITDANEIFDNATTNKTDNLNISFLGLNKIEKDNFASTSYSDQANKQDDMILKWKQRLYETMGILDIGMVNSLILSNSQINEPIKFSVSKEEEMQKLHDAVNNCRISLNILPNDHITIDDDLSLSLSMLNIDTEKMVEDSRIEVLKDSQHLSSNEDKSNTTEITQTNIQPITFDQFYKTASPQMNFTANDVLKFQRSSTSINLSTAQFLIDHSSSHNPRNFNLQHYSCPTKTVAALRLLAAIRHIRGQVKTLQQQYKKQSYRLFDVQPVSD